VSSEYAQVCRADDVSALNQGKEWYMMDLTGRASRVDAGVRCDISSIVT
jgi:hypothetical protein